MSITTTNQAHITYELIDDTTPDLVVIEFLTHDIVGPTQAREFGRQLDSLIRSDLPRIFVIDFRDVRSLGSTAFGEIVLFARKLARLYVCNLGAQLRFGGALVGLDDCAIVGSSRWAAINAARRFARKGEDDTVDYPVSRL